MPYTCAHAPARGGGGASSAVSLAGDLAAGDLQGLRQRAGYRVQELKERASSCTLVPAGGVVEQFAMRKSLKQVLDTYTYAYAYTYAYTYTYTYA